MWRRLSTAVRVAGDGATALISGVGSHRDALCEAGEVNAGRLVSLFAHARYLALTGGLLGYPSIVSGGCHLVTVRSKYWSLGQPDGSQDADGPAGSFQVSVAVTSTGSSSVTLTFDLLTFPPHDDDAQSQPATATTLYRSRSLLVFVDKVTGQPLPLPARWRRKRRLSSGKEEASLASNASSRVEGESGGVAVRDWTLDTSLLTRGDVTSYDVTVVPLDTMSGHTHEASYVTYCLKRHLASVKELEVLFSGLSRTGDRLRVTSWCPGACRDTTSYVIRRLGQPENPVVFTANIVRNPPNARHKSCL